MLAAQASLEGAALVSGDAARATLRRSADLVN
jgi:hypothetical protein